MLQNDKKIFQLVGKENFGILISLNRCTKITKAEIKMYTMYINNRILIRWKI